MKFKYISLLICLSLFSGCACGNSKPTDEIIEETETIETEEELTEAESVEDSEFIEPTEIEVVNTEEKVGTEPETETPEENKTQSANNANISKDHYQWYKDTFGLTDEEIANLTVEENNRLISEWTDSFLNGGSGGSSSGSSGSSSSGGSNGGGGDTTGDTNDNDLPTADLGNPEDTLPGGM